MRVFTYMQVDGRNLRIPAGTILRKFSIVIIGSTCNICGRNFKCETDVAMHKRWRHNEIIEFRNGNLDCQQNNNNYIGTNNEKCDICSKQFDNISDLKIQKRRVHKYRKNTRSIRLIIKIGGVIMTELRLSRKYLKKYNNEHLVDISTQTDLFENMECQDYYGANIDFSLPENVVSDIETVQPHKVTNRYIVDKFSSNNDDTIKYHSAMGRNLIEISSTPNRDIIFIDGDLCKEYRNEIFQVNMKESMSDTLTASIITNITDNRNINDKENSRTVNSAKDLLSLKNQSTHYLNKISLRDSKVFLTWQRDKPNETFLSKQIFSVNEKYHNFIKRSDEVVENRINVGSKDSTIELIEIVMDENKNEDNLNESITSLAGFKGEVELGNFNNSAANVDDDVQEVLRITRGNTQCDINHESPNRSEREMLIQNAAREMHTFHTWRENIHQKRSRFSSKMNNNQSSDNSSFQAIIGNSCQFLPNDITFRCKTFDEKPNISFKDLQCYENECYNDLSEINNNNLDQCTLQAYEDFNKSCMQIQGSKRIEMQHIDGLKETDNEIMIHLIE